jgi:hypothetical protein
VPCIVATPKTLADFAVPIPSHKDIHPPRTAQNDIIMVDSQYYRSVLWYTSVVDFKTAVGRAPVRRGT